MCRRRGSCSCITWIPEVAVAATQTLLLIIIHITILGAGAGARRRAATLALQPATVCICCTGGGGVEVVETVDALFVNMLSATGEEIMRQINNAGVMMADGSNDK